METDDTAHEETRPDSQMICDAIRRAVADGCAASYWSLDRLLAARKSDEMREQLRADITRDFTQLGRPVPRDTPWHMVYIRLDGLPDDTYRIFKKPDLVLPGYVIVMACDQDQYLAAQQHLRDLVAKKLTQATFN